MPTPKQVRYHYKKCSRLFDRLIDALNAAHRAKVLEYTDYSTESPCRDLFVAVDKFNKTTEIQLARAMREEIRSEK